jgi:hypothetical protein
MSSIERKIKEIFTLKIGENSIIISDQHMNILANDRIIGNIIQARGPDKLLR